MRSVQKVSVHVLWKIETFIEEDRRSKKHCTWDNDALVPYKVGTLGPHTVLPSTINRPVIFSWISSMAWNSSLSKVILILRKGRSHRAPNLGCSGAESPGWFDASPKSSARDVMHEWVCCCEEAANHQLPIAAAFWIIWIVSTEECSVLTQNWRQIHCSTQLFW